MRMAVFDDIIDSLFETSGTLVALFDPQDILRRSNATFRDAYGIAEDETLSWAQIVRRNFEQRRGVAFTTDDVNGFIEACDEGEAPEAVAARWVNEHRDLVDGWTKVR